MFHVSDSDLFQLLRETGFDVLDFRELFAPDDAVDHPYYQWVPAEWGSSGRPRRSGARASARAPTPRGGGGPSPSTARARG